MTDSIVIAQALADAGYLSDADLDAAAEILADALIDDAFVAGVGDKAIVDEAESVQ